MSNLTLKRMNTKSLEKYVTESRNPIVSLGYNTDVERYKYSEYGRPALDYVIRYHNNAIAWLGDWEVQVSNAGWGTATTRNRLNMILRDNNIPATVGQKNNSQTLTFAGKVWTDFKWAQFVMESGVWTLKDGEYK